MGNKLLTSKASNVESKNGRIKKRGSFILSTLRRSASLRRMSWMPRPHLDCRTWLSQLQLPQYIDAFGRFGGVEEILYYDEKQIQDEIGIKISSHRNRIIASLESLREKYENNQKLKVDTLLRTSLIEGEENRNFRIEQLEISPEVVLRQTKSPDRRNAQKREAAVINPDKIEMPLETEDSPKGDPGEGELRKLLDTELSLDNSDLRSHAWYHGSISRARAEEVCSENGNFIIRDCISQPGDFVLTCRWNNQTIHVIIQKTIIQPNTIYERIQYKLEDEAYDTIPDLVTAYVGSKRPVTILSGAKICAPVNRTAPLSYYLSKYAAQAEHTRLHGTLSRPPTKTTPPPKPASYLKREPIAVGCSIIRTSPPRARKDLGPVNRSQRPSSGTFEERLTHSGDGVSGCSNSVHEKTNAFTSNSLPRRLNSSSLSLPPQPLSSEVTSDISEQPSKGENSLLENPPPKPSRVPSVKVKPQRPSNITNPRERVYAEIDEDEETPVFDEKEIISSESKIDDGSYNEKTHDKTNEFTEFSSMRHSRLSEVYQPSGSDSGNGSGDSVQTSASDSRNRDSQASFCDSGFILAEDDSVTEEESLFNIPDMCPPSAFDLEGFSTLLLPSIENRPLDTTAFKGIKNTLSESGSRILAAHLTKVDLDLLNGTLEKDLGLGVSMGVELITLPQGSQLRKDLIDRTECLKLLVAVSILKAEDLGERAEMIYRWIQIAIDTKTAMGNLYGFTGIMLGLCIPEVQRLTLTWHTVRQKYTDSAFKFESKLRSTLKSMNECSNPQAPNTTIPHILPYILLCERDLEDIYSLHTKGSSLFQWESTASDYGLQMLYSHLQEGRMFTQNLTLYKRNAELLLGDMKHMDELTLDMFRTEFQLKFLFGSRAAFADNDQRMPKFQKVIATLSEFCEPSS